MEACLDGVGLSSHTEPDSEPGVFSFISNLVNWGQWQRLESSRELTRPLRARSKGKLQYSVLSSKVWNEGSELNLNCLWAQQRDIKHLKSVK